MCRCDAFQQPKQTILSAFMVLKTYMCSLVYALGHTSGINLQENMENIYPYTLNIY